MKTLRTVGPAKQVRELERNEFPTFSHLQRRAPILLPRNWKNVYSAGKPPCGHLTCEQSDCSFQTEFLLRRRIASLARFRSQKMATRPIWWPRVPVEMAGKGSSTSASTFHGNEACLPVRPFGNNQTFTHIERVWIWSLKANCASNASNKVMTSRCLVLSQARYHRQCATLEGN